MAADLAAAVLVLFALPLLLACGWLALLVLLPARRAPPLRDKTLRFDVIVPAHDEAQCIVRTVHSLLQLDWPKTHFRVLVVADNCSDDTAAIALAAGAEVVERQDSTLRGKGPALEFAYGMSAREGRADAVVVVDADSTCSSNLLMAFAARLAHGAEALQCNYGVLNGQASWRTRLMSLALTLVNRLRRRGRDALGGSAGLAGNGMCFTHALLARVPHRAHSLAEDLEYGIVLGCAGVRIGFVDEASVSGEMVSGERGARSQRARWEGGRRLMRREHLKPLLKRALRGDGLALDLALDLLLPPLATLVLLLLLGSTLALALALTTGSAVWILYALCTVLLFVHGAVGIRASGLGWRVLIDLVQLPRYMLWKLLRARPATDTTWRRTEREVTGKKDSIR